MKLQSFHDARVINDECIKIVANHLVGMVIMDLKKEEIIWRVGS